MKLAAHCCALTFIIKGEDVPIYVGIVSVTGKYRNHGEKHG